MEICQGIPLVLSEWSGRFICISSSEISDILAEIASVWQEEERFSEIWRVAPIFVAWDVTVCGMIRFGFSYEEKFGFGDGDEERLKLGS